MFGQFTKKNAVYSKDRLRYLVVICNMNIFDLDNRKSRSHAKGEI